LNISDKSGWSGGRNGGRVVYLIAMALPSSATATATIDTARSFAMVFIGLFIGLHASSVTRHVEPPKFKVEVRHIISRHIFRQSFFPPYLSPIFLPDNIFRRSFFPPNNCFAKSFRHRIGSTNQSGRDGMDAITRRTFNASLSMTSTISINGR